MLKTAQSAIEYLMIIAFTFAIIIPTIYLFFSYSRESTAQLSDFQINSIGRNIITTAESIYYSGEHSKTVLEFNMPENVYNMSILGNRELVFGLETGNGRSDLVFFSAVNLTSNNCDSFACYLSPLASRGVNKLKIESINQGKIVHLEEDVP